MYNPMLNTYTPGNPYQSVNPYEQRLQSLRPEVIRVNGENGARAYNLPPNSSALLLDETEPVVWLKTTDGAGYATVTPYQITPLTPAPVVDVNSLEERIKRLEDAINGKSYTGSTEQE